MNALKLSLYRFELWLSKVMEFRTGWHKMLNVSMYKHTEDETLKKGS